MLCEAYAAPAAAAPAPLTLHCRRQGAACSIHDIKVQCRAVKQKWQHVSQQFQPLIVTAVVKHVPVAQAYLCVECKDEGEE